MGNRIFKDQICRSKDLCRVSFFGESLFFHLILCCDDMGRFSADTRMIKGFAYPLWDHVTPEMIGEGLDELEAIGLIVRYTVEDSPYLYLPAWEKHQKLKFRKTVFPVPPVQEAADACDNAMDALDAPPASAEAKEEGVAHARVINNNIYNFEVEVEVEAEAEGTLSVQKTFPGSVRAQLRLGEWVTCSHFCQKWGEKFKKLL